MRVAATLAAIGSLAAGGCIYIDPINQRPSLDIRQTSSEQVHRGDDVELEAIANDPEENDVEFRWNIRACTDAAVPSDCDPVPLFDGASRTASFRVPPFREDVDGDGPAIAAPVASLRVVLTGEDDRGADARPAQLLIIPVLNAPPTLRLSSSSTDGTSVVTMPIEVHAKYGDADDTHENVSRAWTLVSPTGAESPLVEFDVQDDAGQPEFAQVGVGFTPTVTGRWTVRVAATDRTGEHADAAVEVQVVADGPPCLALWNPLASPIPTPLTELKQFEVNQVRDELDAFPRMSDQPFFGETTFQWSLLVGQEPRRMLGNTTERVALDPSAYTPGTILELRVEIFDRNATPIPCADAAATCSVISQANCIQRQTWRVEAR